MPEEDGLSIIRDLKSRTNVPVIMLTATASPIDRVVGLELGADDYIAKPCELRELMARIRSVLRRSAPAKVAPEAASAKAETWLQEIFDICPSFDEGAADRPRRILSERHANFRSRSESRISSLIHGPTPWLRSGPS